jgi:O-acetylserine/cysteine efflux transporter
MRPRDIALAVGLMAVWGLNFVAIETGLERMPPLLFCALRFALAAFPAVLFAGRPQVGWRWVLTVGLSLGVVKFGLLFAGMAAGMPAGLTSLVLQSQAIFTTVFAVALLRESPGARRWIGLGVATLGVLVVALRVGVGGPVGAFGLVLAAAAAWGLSNVAMRKALVPAPTSPASPPDMLRFMVWVSAVATLPLFGLSLMFEGPPRVSLDLPLLGALLYIAGISTLAGFAVWGTLIRRYSAATVAPFSMLVPFFGMSSAVLFLHEQLHLIDLAGGALVVAGILYGASSSRGHVAAGRPMMWSRVRWAHGRGRTSHSVP